MKLLPADLINTATASFIAQIHSQSLKVKRDNDKSDTTVDTTAQMEFLNHSTTFRLVFAFIGMLT